MSDSVLRRVITQRRSLRRYKPDPVPREMLETLLSVAIWAPSAHNRQPWRFAIITQLELKQSLAQTMGERLRRDLERDGVAETIIAQDLNRSYERLTQAPVLLLLCLSMRDMDTYADERRQHFERVMAIQSVAMAGQNILLMAHELGLGACWMCAPLFCAEAVRDVLNLPDDWEAQGVISLGFPDQSRDKSRDSLEEKVLWR